MIKYDIFECLRVFTTTLSSLDLHGKFLEYSHLLPILFSPLAETQKKLEAITKICVIEENYKFFPSNSKCFCSFDGFLIVLKENMLVKWGTGLLNTAECHKYGEYSVNFLAEEMETPCALLNVKKNIYLITKKRFIHLNRETLQVKNIFFLQKFTKFSRKFLLGSSRFRNQKFH
jgi:hypothetical protein